MSIEIELSIINAKKNLSSWFFQRIFLDTGKYHNCEYHNCGDFGQNRKLRKYHNYGDFAGKIEICEIFYKKLIYF